MPRQPQSPLRHGVGHLVDRPYGSGPVIVGRPWQRSGASPRRGYPNRARCLNSVPNRLICAAPRLQSTLPASAPSRGSARTAHRRMLLGGAEGQQARPNDTNNDACQGMNMRSRASSCYGATPTALCMP
jgi:hypothetical protein